ncbi:hypothetical protein [Microlunatus flavus]|uniref:Uncharacterized protein n=1 Tax=Microlunatus flavus TaxID=1036181 RepID=A0A1H9H6T8_9ACTN|nr:hypothetical protein [Microlunatus flavus]SEQ57957.1 hypothetical protein SAMN05421756_104136 [Microlunatus flavus]
MHALVEWSGFVGAWLLVAGPLFQAAVELDEQGDHRRGLTRASDAVGPPPRLSPWWWLLPPVAYVKQRRRQAAYRERIMDALTTGELEAFIDLSSTATGWALVASGAFFIAVKETWELLETYEAPAWLLPVVLVLLLALCAAYTVVRVRWAHGVVDAKRRAAAGAA